jgi:hypothetical protein
MATKIGDHSYLTTAEAAARLGVSVGRVAQFRADGRLRGVLVIDRWLYRAGEVDSLARIPRRPGKPSKQGV